MNLLHIESRPSKQDKNDYTFFVACDNTTGGMKAAVDELRNSVKSLSVLSRDSEFLDEDNVGE